MAEKRGLEKWWEKRRRGRRTEIELADKSGNGNLVASCYIRRCFTPLLSLP